MKQKLKVESRISITINNNILFDSGKVVPFDEDFMREELSTRDITVDIELGMGQEESTVYTSDLSFDYVKINAEYTT